MDWDIEQWCEPSQKWWVQRDMGSGADIFYTAALSPFDDGTSQEESIANNVEKIALHTEGG